MLPRTVGALARLRPPAPRPKPLRSRWFRVLALGFLCGFSLARCSAIAEDEVLCEEAVAKLRECCGQRVGNDILCYRDASNGCSRARVPQISSSKSLCLLRNSCEQLRAGGSCDPEVWAPMKGCGLCQRPLDTSYMCCHEWTEPLCN